MLHARGYSKITRQAIESTFSNSERQTLGKLIADVKKRISIPQEIENDLMDCLKDRNYLIHRYFSSHDIDFGSDIGCRKMIQELRSMTERFQKTDRAVERLTIPLWESIGVTRAIMTKEYERMIAEAKALDQNSD